MAVTSEKPAPYAPASAILNLITRYRTRGLQTPVNADVLARASVSDSLIPRTLQAMQALDLIDENGMPTETFEGIRKAPEVEYQSQLAEWLKAAYAEVFSYVDPAKDEETAVRDAFRSYEPIGQQPRMVTLFMGLCAAAGLTPERTTPVRTPRARTLSSKPNAPRTTGKSSAKTHRAHAPNLPAPIAGLLDSLPEEGSSWTKERRDMFLTTFGTVLDFCFPVVDGPDGDDIADEELRE